MAYINELLVFADRTVVFDNTVTTYLVALLIAVGSYLILYLFKTYVVNKIQQYTHVTTTVIDDALIESIKNIPPFTYSMISIYLGAQRLVLPGWLDKAITALFIVLVIGQVGIVIKAIIMHAFTTHPSRQQGSQNTLSIVRIFLNITIWSVVVLLILTNLGVAITPLLTSLGIMGVAVAFALQNILEDLFSSVSIYLDKPFRIGDFVEVDGIAGSVTEIGIKTTRIKTIRGEEVVIANRHIIDKVLQNYGKIQHRTVRSYLSIPYTTNPTLVAKIPELIQQAIDPIDHATYERAHFTTFGEYALQVEYMYTIDDKEYILYLDTQQAIHLALLKLFAKHKISFAYPTQKVLIEK